MIISLLLMVGSAQASFTDVKHAYDSGQYFSAARMAFNDANHAGNKADQALARYFAIHESRIEKTWFNILTPNGQTIDNLKEDLQSLSEKK